MSTSFIAPVLGNLSAPPAEPFYFGAEGSECLAWLHRPALGKARNLGVVLCNALGYELMLGHRTYRYLATRLAAEGCATLRFEYPSTGDSAGFVDDPGRVAAWLVSIREACEALKKASGVSQIVLFGLRGGGTLAGSVAADVPGVVGFAAWAPFASGSLLLREFRALASLNAHSDYTPNITRADGGLHVAGYGLSVETVKGLEGLSLTKLTRAPAPRCLLMVRDDLPADSRLEKHWTSLGCAVQSVAVPGYVAMMRDAFESQLPLAAVETLVTWVLDLSSDPVAEAPTDVRSTSANFKGQLDGPVALTERPVRFGVDHSLVGILSTPINAPARKTAVLFATVGANHHVGSNRLHVELGRELAELGYLCLRMDIDGAGESGTVCERERFWEYKVNSHDDVAEGARWLAQQPGIEGCVLWGICSGAYMAYHAAQAENKVVGAMLFNIQLFRWKEEEVAENLARNQAKSFGFYRQMAFRAETWKRLFAGGIHLRTIFLGLSARIKKRLKGRLSLVMSKMSKTSDAPLREVADLSKRECRVSFVCTPEDTGLHEIKTHLGANAAEAVRFPGVEYVEVGHDTAADHTFTSLASQQWVKTWTRSALLERFR